MKELHAKARPPHVREIIYAEPFLLARRLKGAKSLLLLESVQRHEHLGRYSFLAATPRFTLKVEAGQVLLDGQILDEQPLSAVQRLLDENAQSHVDGLPPFQGGLAGYIAYEFGRWLEPKARIADFPCLTPDLVLHCYDTVVGIDHLQERAWIFARNETDADNLELALKEKPNPLGQHSVEGFVSNFDRPAYERAVAATVEDILAGDIFQANITQDFSATRPPDFDPFAFYQKLRNANPATFAALLDDADVQLISSSPERLVKFDGVRAEARPIKGTRRRDPDLQRDAALITELQASRKDRAENVMIVDLLRNDLSKVCKAGTVKVPVLCGLESYANVHHLVSVVEGELQEGKRLTDLLAAVFPGGSITGAPKIRAMEIIAAREQQARGVYCGSIGYLGFNGHADFNIAIRTVQATKTRLHVQGGGGITAKSQSAAEYDESLVKIARIMEAFRP